MSMISIPVAVPLTGLAARCEQFTKEFIWGPAPVSVTVEILSPELGDQLPIRSAMVRGIAYDPRSTVLELSLEDGDHRIAGVREVWVATEGGGFVELIEVVRADGGKEILSFVRARRRSSLAPSPGGARDR